MDKIVVTARQLLGDAIQALDRGDGYNTKHPYEASFPNGFADHCRMIMECIMRLDATKERDKAADCLAYIALYCGWVIDGCPKSEFAYISNRYMNLFKIQESKIELQKMEGKLNCDRCCGSGMIQVENQVGACPECNGTGGQNCCDGAAPNIEKEQKIMEESK